MKGETPRPEEANLAPEEPTVPTPAGEAPEAPQPEIVDNPEGEIFDYEAKRAEIEKRFEERMEKFKVVVEEIFRDTSEFNDAQRSFENTLSGALDRQEGRKAPLKEGEPEEVKMALALDKKRKEIVFEKEQALMALEEKKVGLQNKKIQEI